jgi:hypothetical protein
VPARIHYPAGIPVPLRCGAVPSSDPTNRPGPHNRDPETAGMMARDQAEVWRALGMGERREAEREAAAELRTDLKDAQPARPGQRSRFV